MSRFFACILYIRIIFFDKYFFFFFNRPGFLFHVTRNDTWQISTHLNYRHRDRFNYHTTDA